MTGEPLRMLLLDVDDEVAARLRAIISGHDGSDPLVQVPDVAAAVAALGREDFDAVLVGGRTATDRDRLGRVRTARGGAAIVLVRSVPGDVVPLDPQDVGSQTTLDTWGLDDRTLALTLHLAIERHRLALAQEHARMQALAMSELSRGRDPLTGLPSGERLLEEIDLFVADAIRFTRPLTVALLEVVGLDELRSREGVGRADTVMIHTAGVLDQCLRTSDLLGRLDQDQVLVAMPGTSEQAGARAAARIQARLAAVPCEVRSWSFRLDTWIGIASLTGLMAVDELVFLADGALAIARSTGAPGIHRASAGMSVG